MKQWTQHVWLWLEQGLPWAVLGVLVLYTYAELFYAPYIGFRFSANSGEIRQIFVKSPVNIELQEGDMLKQVGAVTWEQYSSNLRQQFFPHTKSGQVLTLIVERNRQRLIVPWLIQTPSLPEVLDRALNIWWLAYVFWLAGTATILFLRPKDTRWRLLNTFYFLTAIWLATGNVSHWGFGDSAIVLRVTIWLSMPIYLHLHTLFPHPLLKLNRTLLWGTYGLSFVLAILQWFQYLPARAYLYGFLLAVVGCLLLLVAQLLRSSHERRQARFLFAMISLAFIAVIAVDIIQIVQPQTWFGPAGLLALPLIPIAYFYAAFRRQLGQQELRANKLITLYVFIISVGTVIILLVTVITMNSIFSPWASLSSVTISLFTAILTALGFPAFERFIERHLLGIALASSELVEIYTASITTSLSYSSLVRLLGDKVLPSLLVRQSALLQLDGEHIVRSIYLQNVEAHLLPQHRDVQALLKQAPKYRMPAEEITSQPCSWIRLVVPLWINNQCIGLWLLGKRDPDDFYAQSEITTFRVLANQTAIALTNIQQAEQLQAVYQANIDRHEIERTNLARVLHDEVLHQLALLSMHVEEIKALPQFDEAYLELTRRIRQLITGLRPAMMNYGLRSALEELAEDLKERASEATEVKVTLIGSQTRYPVKIEQYIFRIAQQACENALKHAHATIIQVNGQLELGTIHIVISDDGIGFSTGNQSHLTTLLANKHFGLVGMYERAAIIGANLELESIPGQGTKVTVTWQAARALSI